VEIEFRTKNYLNCTAAQERNYPFKTSLIIQNGLDQNNVQNHGVSELCPLFGILNTRRHNISETGSVSFLRWERNQIQFPKRRVLCLIRIPVEVQSSDILYSECYTPSSEPFRFQNYFCSSLYIIIIRTTPVVRSTHLVCNSRRRCCFLFLFLFRSFSLSVFASSLTNISLIRSISGTVASYDYRCS
jgi:hypothetical protein